MTGNYSITRRFAASLTANVIRSAIGFLTGVFLARWMGPQEYGRMAFLLATFLAYRQFLDMATSSAFFTFLSQRPRSARFVRWYWMWIAVQFGASLALIGLLLPGDWIASIWKGEHRGLVALAFVAAFMQGAVWPVASQMAEAHRETVRVQRIATVVVLINAAVLLVLWLLGRLAIPLVFAALAVEWGAAAWFAARLHRAHDEPTAAAGDSDTPRSVVAQYWRYCLPLIPYAWLGFVHDFADRWMLQHWGGATQQAYYAVAAQFAAVALLATTSMLQIFWKEIAEAYERKDLPRVEWLFRTATRGLFFIGAVVAGGLLPWSAEILTLALGAGYVGGATALMIMFLYPVHQSVGQVVSTLLFGTGHTRQHAMLGSVFMLLSLTAAYLMMAPKESFIPGLGLASEGLAYKMVILQIIQVNALTYLCARLFNWRFDWGYQVAGLGIALGTGWLAKLIVEALLAASPLVLMAVAMPTFLLLLLPLVYAFPSITVGLDRDAIRSFARSGRTFITS